MFAPKTLAQSASEDAGTTKARMRRALDLEGALPSYPAQQRSEQARTRRYFVQDGEVPVGIVTGSRVSDAAPGGRIAALQAALDGERTARAGAERALVERIAC